MSEDRTTGVTMNDAVVEDYLRQRGKCVVDPAQRGTVHYASPSEEFMKLMWTYSMKMKTTILIRPFI